jgi:hypothetical protein
MQVDGAPEHVAQLTLQVDELEQADVRLGLELDQHVDIALGTEVRAEHRAEEGQAVDVVAPAEASQPLLVDLDLQTHRRHTPSVPRAAVDRSAALYAMHLIRREVDDPRAA